MYCEKESDPCHQLTQAENTTPKRIEEIEAQIQYYNDTIAGYADQVAEGNMSVEESHNASDLLRAEIRRLGNEKIDLENELKDLRFSCNR